MLNFIQFDAWLAWIFPFIRALSLLTLIPFTLSPVPLMVRIALALFLGFIAMPLVPPIPAATSLIGIGSLVAGEILCGALMGFAIVIVYQIAAAAGRFISQEMSLMQSNLFNPASGTSEPLLAIPLGQLVTLMIFLTGAHYHLLYAFIRSFQIAPVGSGFINESSMIYMMQQSSAIFSIGAQMAAPFIAANFIVVFAFSILGRTVPSINVFMLSFPVRILVGFILLGATVTLMGRYLLQPVEGTPERMLRMLSAPEMTQPLMTP